MSSRELLDALSEAKTARKTVKLQVVGTVAGKAKAVTLDVFEGDLTMLRAGALTDAAAVNMLARMAVTHVVEIATSNVARTPTPGTPRIDALLHGLDAGNRVAAP